MALIQWRRGTAAQATTANPVLAAGEAGFETDTGKFKIGDGATAWTSLGYASGVALINDLTDVTITAAASGDIIRHNGTAWVDAVGTTFFDSAGAAAAAQAAAIAASQPLDGDLTSIAALSTTSFGRARLTDADAPALRTAAGVGTISTQAASAVAITGGTVTGITDLTVADGGTGSSTAAVARTNLGIAPAGAEAVRYVSGLGSDSNDGLGAGAPFLTFQAAYAALPSTGGRIVVAPGRYDVGSTGIVLSRGKPVEIEGTVKPPPYVVSTTQAPLSLNCAIFYTSASAVSLFTTTGGTAANRMDGCKWKNLLFEFNDPATLNGIFANSANYGEVTDCYFFADKTSTGIAAVNAVGIRVRATTPGTYGGDDASWWVIERNRCINMALAFMGNDTGTKYNANFHVIRDNVGLGISHSNTSALPFITLYGAHRPQVGPNNIEAYNVGVSVTTSWGGRYIGNAGEFVDVLHDFYDCKCPMVDAVGITYGGLGTAAGAGSIIPGALLVRGDAFVKGGVFILPTWNSANTQRVYPPTNDPTYPSVSLASNDNLIIAHSFFTLPGGVKLMTGTGTPEAAVVGSVGDVFHRTDGSAGTCLYMKESGAATNTGWVGVGSIAAAAVATGLTATATLTNKRITPRVGTVASSATPTINTDNVDLFTITALAAAVTSFTTNLSGTPTDGQWLRIAITDNGTARALAWGASFEAGDVALPTTTVISTRLDVLFSWNTATSKWRSVRGPSTAASVSVVDADLNYAGTELETVLAELPTLFLPIPATGTAGQVLGLLDDSPLDVDWIPIPGPDASAATIGQVWTADGTGDAEWDDMSIDMHSATTVTPALNDFLIGSDSSAANGNAKFLISNVLGLVGGANALVIPVLATADVGSATVTANSSAHTYGTWVELIASTTVDAGSLAMSVSGVFANGVATASVVSFGIGAAASEVELCKFACGSHIQPGTSPNIAADIPAGSRISARIQSLVTGGKQATVSVQLGVLNTLFPPASTVDSLGVDLATSRGVNMPTTDTYVQITAATSRAYRALVVVPSGSSTSMATEDSLYTVGIGAAASEVAFGTVNVASSTSEWVSHAATAASKNGIIPGDVPIGSRIAVKQAVGRNYRDVTVLGIPYA